MGYQESYVYLEDDRKFEELIDLVKKHRSHWEKEWGIEPAGIVTLAEDIKGTFAFMCQPQIEYEFKAGKKMVHIAGERAGQRGLYRMFMNDIRPDMDFMFAECLHFDEAPPGYFLGEEREVACDYVEFDDYLKR